MQLSGLPFLNTLFAPARLFPVQNAQVPDTSRHLHNDDIFSAKHSTTSGFVFLPSKGGKQVG